MDTSEQWWSHRILITATNTISDSGAVGSDEDIKGIDENELNLEFDEVFADEFEEEFESEVIADPFEPLNRAFFVFNDRLYFWVLKPSFKVYNVLLPEWGRIRIDNFFSNVATPISFVGNVLQFKMKDAGTDLARFLINSTLGVGGLFDVAGKEFGLKSTDEDLGQVFAYYGLGDGFYMVIPFLGPSSLRDTIGRVGDRFLSPLGYFVDGTLEFSLLAVRYYNNASLRVGEYEDFIEAAIDPYVAIKDAYFQYRQDQIKK